MVVTSTQNDNRNNDDDEHKNDDSDKQTNANISIVGKALKKTEDTGGALFLSLYEAVVDGPRQSRENVIKQKRRHWLSQTIVAWSFTFSSLCFFFVALLEAFWLWTQVKPRGGTFVDEEGSSSSDDDEKKRRRRSSATKAKEYQNSDTEKDNERVELNRYYPFGNRTAQNGYGGTVSFDDEKAHDDDEESSYTPNDHDYDDDGESENLNRVLDASTIYPLKLFPRPDRRILRSLRIICVCSIVSTFADVFCFVVYTPQMREMLLYMPFKSGKLFGKFLLFWADRLMLVGVACMVAGVAWRVYDRLFLCTAREKALVKYPPFAFCSR